MNTVIYSKIGQVQEAGHVVLMARIGQRTHTNLQWRSADPAANRMLLGCQSRLRTVELMGFLMCLLSHLCNHERMDREDRMRWIVYSRRISDEWKMVFVARVVYLLGLTQFSNRLEKRNDYLFTPPFPTS